MWKEKTDLGGEMLQQWANEGRGPGGGEVTVFHGSCGNRLHAERKTSTCPRWEGERSREERKPRRPWEKNLGSKELDPTTSNTNSISWGPGGGTLDVAKGGDRGEIRKS